jgi:hypothetical protein
MNQLPHLAEIFDGLRRGWHFVPEESEAAAALAAKFPDYAEHFAALGFTLVRHERDFFYLEPSDRDQAEVLAGKIAAVAFILVDHLANEGRAIEQCILNDRFLIGQLPHLSRDSYSALLQQAEVHDASDLRQVFKAMQRFGWAEVNETDEVRFRRPFCRVFTQCLALTEQAAAQKEAVNA